MAESGDAEGGRYDSQGFDTQSPTYVEEVLSHVFGQEAPVHHYVVRSDERNRRHLTVAEATERRITQPEHYRAAPAEQCNREIKNYRWYDTKRYIKFTLDFEGEVNLEQPEAVYIAQTKQLIFRVRIGQASWGLDIPNVRDGIDYFSPPDVALVQSEDGLLTTASWKIYKKTPVPWLTLCDH